MAAGFAGNMGFFRKFEHLQRARFAARIAPNWSCRVGTYVFAVAQLGHYVDPRVRRWVEAAIERGTPEVVADAAAMLFMAVAVVVLERVLRELLAAYFRVIYTRSIAPPRSRRRILRRRGRVIVLDRKGQRLAVDRIAMARGEPLGESVPLFAANLRTAMRLPDGLDFAVATIGAATLGFAFGVSPSAAGAGLVWLALWGARWLRAAGIPVTNWFDGVSDPSGVTIEGPLDRRRFRVSDTDLAVVVGSAWCWAWLRRADGQRIRLRVRPEIAARLVAIWSGAGAPRSA
jgi:hypothetical protein